MDVLDFSRCAYRAAGKYLEYLKAARKGRTEIPVYKIRALDLGKFRVFISCKIPYPDALEMKINCLPEDSSQEYFTFECLSYNEKRGYLDIAVDEETDKLLRTAAPEHVRFESDLTFLVKGVQDWYQEHHNKIHMPPSPQFKRECIAQPENASEEQYRAMQSCLTHAISYVWGPPGTGKTKFVLANMIDQYIQHKQHVLIMAPTNNALEQSLRGVLQVLEQRGISPEKVLRLGKPSSEFLDEYPQACLSSWYEKAMRERSRDIAILEKRLKDQNSFRRASAYIAQFDQLVAALNRNEADAAALQTSVVNLRKQCSAAEAGMAEKQKIIDAAEKELHCIKTKYQRQQRYKMVRTQYSLFRELIDQHRTELSDSYSELNQLEEKQAKLTREMEGRQSEWDQLMKQQEELVREQRTVRNRIYRLLSRGKGEQWNQEQKRLSDRLDMLQTDMDAKQELLKSTANRISYLVANIRRSDEALQGTPQMLEISKTIFGKKLSLDELESKFQKKLDTYENVQLDDQLEQKYESQKVKLKFLKANQETLIRIQSAQKENLRQTTEAVKKYAAKKEELIKNFGKLSMICAGKKLKLQELAKIIRELREKYAGFQVDETLEEQIREAKDKLVPIQQELTDLVKERNVIACTIDYAILHYKDLIGAIVPKMSHVFVDEAAYCPMIKVGVCFSLNLPLTLLGDHMQLPPVCEMDSKMIQNSEENQYCCLWAMSAIHFPDVFLETVNFDLLFQRFMEDGQPQLQNVSIAPLTRTYRFGSTIASILDRYIYQDGFSSAGGVHTELTVLDAPRAENDVSLRVSTSEVDAIGRYLQKYQPEDYVILAPYRDQRRLLEKALHLHNEKVLTIHASQGREWDTVLISVTDGMQRKLFMSSKRKEFQGLKIVNTAVSRAKKNLVLVMDYQAWEHSADELITEIAKADRPHRTE